MTQTPHKPTKRKPSKDAKAHEAHPRVPKTGASSSGAQVGTSQTSSPRTSAPKAATPQASSSQSNAQKPARPTQTVRGKHARVEGSSPSAPTSASAGKSNSNNSQAEKAPRKGFTKGKKILLGVGIAVLAIAIAIVIFMLNAHDDAQDIQGQWQIQGSNATITITDKQIVLTDDVAYDYEMDPWNHTLDLGFFGASGNAQYAFNPDRNELVITESFVNDDGETVENTLTLIRPGTITNDTGNADDSASA